MYMTQVNFTTCIIISILVYLTIVSYLSWYVPDIPVCYSNKCVMYVRPAEWQLNQIINEYPLIQQQIKQADIRCSATQMSNT